MSISENIHSVVIVCTGMSIFFLLGTGIYFRERIKIALWVCLDSVAVLMQMIK